MASSQTLDHDSPNAAPRFPAAWQWIVLLLVSALTTGYGLGGVALTPDEALVAGLGRFLSESTAWGVPQLAGTSTIDQAPLPVWLAALAIDIGGAEVWVVRATSAAAGIVAVFLTTAIAAGLGGRKLGFLTGLVLATSPAPVLIARSATAEILAVTLVTIAIAAAVAATRSGLQSRRRPWISIILFWTAIGVSSTAAVPGLVPAMALIVALVWTASLPLGRVTRTLLHPVGPAIGILLALAWPILLYVQHQGDAYVESWLTPATALFTGHGAADAAWWASPLAAVEGLAPWSVALIVGLPITLWRAARIEGADARLTLVWILAPLTAAVLVPAQTDLLVHLALPGIAMASAFGLIRLGHWFYAAMTRLKDPGRALGTFGILVFAIFLIAGFIRNEIGLALWSSAVVLGAGFFGLGWSIDKRRPAAALATVVVVASSLWFFAHHLGRPAIDPNDNNRRFLAAAEHAAEGRTLLVAGGRAGAWPLFAIDPAPVPVGNVDTLTEQAAPVLVIAPTDIELPACAEPVSVNFAPTRHAGPVSWGLWRLPAPC